MDDFRPKGAYSGIGGSGDGAKEAGEEVSEHEESDFLRASRRREFRERDTLVASMILSRLAVEIFLSLAQDCHLMKSRSVQIRFIVSEGSRRSPDSEEAYEYSYDSGAARLLGSASGVPRSSRSSRITGRVVGF